MYFRLKWTGKKCPYYNKIEEIKNKEHVFVGDNYG